MGKIVVAVTKLSGKKMFQILILSFVSLFFNAQIVGVYCWSNGGYSSDSLNPAFGTHDWIARHALDWLPQEEKQYILNDLEVFLYGTELPDSEQPPDGVGDRSKHHVYCFANGSVQDDASAVRAQEEYFSASSLADADDLTGAVKRLGMMCHYISDVAVFGHVMGDGTEWGAEAHHADYEDYVAARTDMYSDEFSVFITFDGTLDDISAFDATLALARDTTFDVDGNCTCVWMDQNYNWSDQTFRTRCGESLSIAVNTVADVLHTFYAQHVVSEYTSLCLAMFGFAVTFVILCLKRKGARKI